MDAGAVWTTSLSSGCGDLSNTKRSTCAITRGYQKLAPASATGSASTIISGSIRVWTIALRPPFSRPASYEEQDSLDLGAPPPDPRDFSLYRQNGWRYNQCTGAEDRALQRWNPSADSRAGMAGGGCGRPLKSDSPIANLLRAKNGLDNRDHFKSPG